MSLVKFKKIFAARGRERLGGQELDNFSSDSAETFAGSWGITPRNGRNSSQVPDEFADLLTQINLRRTASWIRNDLEPQVARNGPQTLGPNDVLTVHAILIALQHHELCLHDIRVSRIHLAVVEISGKATRWPSKLVDESDRVIARLVTLFGPLSQITVPLFEPGGRLWGICDAADSTRLVSATCERTLNVLTIADQALVHRFRTDNAYLVDNSRAYSHGSLGFKPGQWWLSGEFAFRDGIIDETSMNGGICFNENGAYAIVIKGSEEKDCPSLESLTYRCRPHDRGRFKLTAATHHSRYPVRVLRSHSSGSPHAPQAGIRYDGLYRVVGWAIHSRKSGKGDNALKYEVEMARDDPRPIERVLRYPLAEDVDDSKAFRLSNRERRNNRKVVAASQVEDDRGFSSQTTIEEQIIDKPHR